MGLGKSLAELENMSHQEFVSWQAFYQLEPWGCHPADQRTEYQLQLLYSINSKRGATIPRFIDRDPEAHLKPNPTPEQLDDSVRDFFSGYHNVVRKKARKPRVPRGSAAPHAPLSNENGGVDG